MSRELERAARSAYGAALNGPRGLLAPGVLAGLGKGLAPLGTALPVAAAWSAAYAAIFPQLDPSAVPGAGAAVREVRARLSSAAPDPSLPLPALEALAKLNPATGSNPLAARRLKAALAVARGLACCLSPQAPLFAETAQLLVEAQSDPDYPPNRDKERWQGWLDDVVTRSDRFSVLEILDLLERTVQGTLTGLQPDRFFWEGTGNDQDGFEVWTQDPRSRKLITSAITFTQVTANGGTLFVVVSAASLARDQLRVEYFLEHEVHRYFLASAYSGKFSMIDYRIDDGSAHWRAVT